MAQTIKPLDVVHLFPEMRAELLRILNSLTNEQWNLPTACDGWSVKDVALHIYGDDVGYLSRHRDKDGVTFVTDSFEELVALINEKNDLWVRANRYLSKRMLLTLLEKTGVELHAYLRTINPHEGSHPVSWAGNSEAPMWLQIARELTEYWMHHQHICEALGMDSLKNRKFLHPVLSTFVHALPRTYASVQAPESTIMELSVTGEAADSWFVRREGNSWSLCDEVDSTPNATVTMSDDTAWRMFTKGISYEDVKARATITGNKALGLVMLNSVAILA